MLKHKRGFSSLIVTAGMLLCLTGVQTVLAAKLVDVKVVDKDYLQVHFKDGSRFLGDGRVDMKACAAAINDIGYEGWLVLETAVRRRDRDGSFKKNAAYVRELFGMT